MTADCIIATTRRTNTAVTATPATAKVGVHGVGTSDEKGGVSDNKILLMLQMLEQVSCLQC